MSENRNLTGLNEIEVENSRGTNGRNVLTPPKRKSWLILYIEKFRDPIVLILLVAALITLCFGVVHGDFTESVGIIITILLATGVGFWQEYSAKRKFDAMISNDDLEPVKVRRSGIVQEIAKQDLVVGDIVILSAGDEIPADMKLEEALELKVSEASLTGESIPVSKFIPKKNETRPGYPVDQLLRGTTIAQGQGLGQVTAVGDKTDIGRTTLHANEETNRKTPLEEQLDGLAGRITAAAFLVAALMFIILNIVHLKNNGWSFEGYWSYETLLLELRYLMAAVVVVIVAVPEGLPLSVTLALAFSMKTMARENNLVKKMHACETIGAVQTIFTDKTGTLTESKMTVVEVHAREQDHELLELIGALNSTANWTKGDKVLGNPTEAAILQHISRPHTEQLRAQCKIIDGIPFSSINKYMVTEVEFDGRGRYILMKGAPEVIEDMMERGNNGFLDEVYAQQGRGRRAITAALVKTDSFAEFKALLDERAQGKNVYIPISYIGTWFIEDPVRKEVPLAIKQCYRAGIKVVMLTGDNMRTAREIAQQAGFCHVNAVRAADFMPTLDSLNDIDELPNVIARCTPTDKLEVLRWAQEKNIVCGMTGDGVNDSPSLNHADVGIAMGSGTAVAKEAADIILLDDAFPSIVTGVKWGRSLFKNIKNFLFFQLSINVSACLIALLGPLVGVALPFTVTQFLWINLVMDSLAAIALASEPADERVLDEAPRSRSEFIIDKRLAWSILAFGLAVCLLSITVLWGRSLGMTIFDSINLTVFFAGYMMLNWWNIFNARVFGKNQSVFTNLFRNMKFIGTTLIILIVTILIVQYGGEVFRTEPLSWQTWGHIILWTSPVLIVRELWHAGSRLFGKDTKNTPPAPNPC